MERGTMNTLIRAAAVVAVTATGLAGAAVAGCGTGAAARHTAAASNPTYNYYRSMMSRYHGGMMMGGGPGHWMMGAGGYRWMTGVGGVPGWMHGGRLPGYMMGASTDPGKVMGRFWANAPGPRVSPAMAVRLGNQVPAGAHVNRATRTISFTGSHVRVAVLASPAGGPDETFRIAGLVNPTLVVPVGARVSIEIINADPDTAHGLVITASRDSRSWMPMMTARPAFTGSGLWFLGNPTRAGMHVGTITFTATAPGTYRYLRAVPGHARKGMIGTFIVSTSH